MGSPEIMQWGRVSGRGSLGKAGESCNSGTNSYKNGSNSSSYSSSDVSALHLTKLNS